MVDLSRLRHPLLIGAGALGLTALGFSLVHGGADWACTTWTPQLERSLSKMLGQPVDLGPFRGLRPWGLALGPSSIEPRGQSRSQVNANGLIITIAPLASLREGALQLRLELDHPRIRLRPNSLGQYWMLGRRDPAIAPPRLGVGIVLRQPAPVELAPSGSRWLLQGDSLIEPHRRHVLVRSSLTPQGAGNGALVLQLDGQWLRPRWRARLGLQHLAIRDLISLLPAAPRFTVPGRLNGELDLSIGRGQPSCQGMVLVQGAISRGSGLQLARLHCNQQRLRLEPSTLRLGQWHATVQAQARWPGGRRLALESFALQRGTSWIRGSGQLATGPVLHSRWRLDPKDLPRSAKLPAWLERLPLAGSFNSSGSWQRPKLTLSSSGPGLPVLGGWQAALGWQPGVLQLERFNSRYLQASGTLPVHIDRAKGLRLGALQLDVALKHLPLQRLRSLLPLPLAGNLDASGSLQGPLQNLSSTIDLELIDPAVGPLQLRERWQGQWRGELSTGSQFALASAAPAPAGSLTVQIGPHWRLQQLKLDRGGGKLALGPRNGGWQWQARGLLLNGIALELGRLGAQPLRGELSGGGRVTPHPLALEGTAQLLRPSLLGIRLQHLQLSGRLKGGSYRLSTNLEPQGEGVLNLESQGRWGGPFALRASARRFDADTLRQLTTLWPRWQNPSRRSWGNAKDLGSLIVDTLGQSLQNQLQALARAQAELVNSGRSGNQPSGNLQTRLRQLQARVDADLTLEGANLRQAQVDLAAKVHLWRRGNDQDLVLSETPLVARLKGALIQGQGEMNLEQIPLALLAVLTPIPEELRGSLNLRGRYGLSQRRRDLDLQLSLQQAQLGSTALTLKRGQIKLDGDVLNLDLALQPAGTQNSVDLAGLLPLDPNNPSLELRLASRGDGLRFLTAVAEPDLSWRRGSADLQLLLRGSLNAPIANGFLRIRNGELGLIGQTMRDLEATVVFDFKQLEVQQLAARVGSQGSLQAAGHLGLLTPSPSQPPLEVNLNQIPFNLPRIQAMANGKVEIGGSLQNLELAGRVAIDQGSINAQPGRLVPLRAGKVAPAPSKSVAQLLQDNWDFQSPLLLVGSQVETNSSQRVLRAVPRFSALGFNELKLKLGPNLRIVIPNAASFKTAGTLRLSGRLDSSLRARGVLRLLQGRLNLFTTTFSLDPDTPNTATFTPALGLIPYLDIAMRTRVADRINIPAANPAWGPSVTSFEGQGALSSLNQLNLVRITVSVEGPADRLAQSIRLRSSPPMPSSRLIALIGGNSLAGLGAGGAGAAIATVVGQTLLSPVLGGISDALGQRISFALYPTYVNPNVANTAVLQSRQLPPQLVLGSEIGLDITDRFNASVLAAPNRSDVPPQINLNVRATDLINVQGSVDTQGGWQTQVQLFFRF